MAGAAVRMLLFSSFRTAPLNTALYVDLPANLLGCLVMGVAVQLAIEPALPWLWAPPLLQGVTKGFCGSLTSFSSWMVATTMACLSCGGSGWCWAVVAYQIVSTWLMCEGSFRVGQHAGAWLRQQGRFPEETQRVSVASLVGRSWQRWWGWALLLAALVACGAWLAAAPGVFPAALLFSPVGAWLRVALGELGGWRGIMAANIGGSALSSVALLMWSAAGQSGALVALPSAVASVVRLPDMAVLAGALSFGFCGSLSTVSTLMADCRRLPVGVALGNWMASVVASLALCFVILAPVSSLARPL